MPAETCLIDGAPGVRRADRDDEQIEVSEHLVVNGVRALRNGRARRCVEDQRELRDVPRERELDDLGQNQWRARALGGSDVERRVQMWSKTPGIPVQPA